MKRRSVLVSVVAALAGCSGTTEDGTPSENSDVTQSPTPSPSSTPSPSQTPVGTITVNSVEEDAVPGLRNEIDFEGVADYASVRDGPIIKVTVETDAGSNSVSDKIVGDNWDISIEPAEGTSEGATVRWTVELVQDGRVVDSSTGEYEGYEEI